MQKEQHLINKQKCIYGAISKCTWQSRFSTEMSILRTTLDPIQYSLLSGIKFMQNHLFTMKDISLPCGKSLFLGLWDFNYHPSQFFQFYSEICSVESLLVSCLIRKLKEICLADIDREDLRILLHPILCEFIRKSLSQNQVNELSGLIYSLCGSPTTNDLKWGENHLLIWKKFIERFSTIRIFRIATSKISNMG